MMPIVRIPEPIFERLQAIATPFVDTPASVVEKLLDFYDSHNGRDAPPAPPRRVPEPSHLRPTQRFEATAPPDLKHTDVLSAEFDGRTEASWNGLVREAHRCGLERLGSFGDLHSVSTSNIVQGRRADKGFHYFADIDVSIQHVDANSAWRNALHLAKRLNVPIRADFEWRDKPGALHPGQRGTLSWSPSDRKREGWQHAPGDAGQRS